MIKQVIVMRKDLGMRKGKMIAQGAHASMKVFFDRLEDTEICEDDGEYPGYSFKVNKEEQEWISGRFTKIVVSCDSEEELLAIVAKAKAAKLPVALIQDAGKTEFAGVPTYTCCAVGPAKEKKVDRITGGLKLL